MQRNLFKLFGVFFLLIGGACANDADMENTYNGLSNDSMYQEDIGPYSNISSESTTLNSDEFPHTKAIQVQEAKFEYQIDFNQQHNKVHVQEGGGQKGLPQKTPAKEEPSEETQQPAESPPADAEQDQSAPPEEAQKATEPETEQPAATEAEGNTDFEQQVIELTNVQRRNNGLSDLQAHTELSNVARKKSADMQQNNYFSHTSPTYGSPFDMIRDFGISYTAAAENIAQGQPTPEQVVDSWMNSEGHRQNILNGNFTHIGVGYEANGHHWTQMFITK
ncbi:MAG: CAP domain-containing protein [Bacillus sp. (in: Bacteria)]|nr:CAP domain-containing protein [Bacillus sp. (in: firmicutes)]